MEGNLAITVKTKNALDPTTLLLGIHPIDTLPCEQNNMHNDTSYSIVCKCKLAKTSHLTSSRKPINKSHYIHIELYAAIKKKETIVFVLT